MLEPTLPTEPTPRDDHPERTTSETSQVVISTPARSLAELMARISVVLPEGGDWCSLAKAQTLAALIVGFRPRTICEIGVWRGGSMVPMLLALRAIGDLEIADHGIAIRRRAIAIDAWSADASQEGQDGDNLSWWKTVNHDDALAVFLGRIERLGLASLCDVVRAASDRAPVPESIDLLHVDGNHAGQAVRDVERFGAVVPVGGILILDDLHWAGGHVTRARDIARELGFRELYPLGTGVVLQRVHA